MHPTTRAERRYQRERVIAKRRYIYDVIWGESNGYSINRRRNPLEPGYHWEIVYGKYAKWNLNCGDSMCHAEKYFKNKRKRRNARRSCESAIECRHVDKKIPARLWKNLFEIDEF